MKALIKVGYGCNEHCTFCHTMDVRHIDGSAAEVHRKIDRAGQLGYTMVVLSGGEPTIRPELMAWSAHVARLGMDLGLITNGQMLAYPELIERLRAHRLRYVYMSYHGGDADVHQRLTRSDGWERSTKALDNLAGTGIELTVNTVVTRQNVDALIPIVDRVLPYPDATLKFSMVAPKGGGERNFEIITPRVARVAERVVEAIEYGERRARERGGPRFAHDGIPLCLLPGHEHQYADLKTDEFASMTEIGEPDYFPVDDVIKIQPGECRGCSLSGPCPGLYRGYHEYFGADELRPDRARPRSNSFNYVLEKVIGPASDEHCPLRDGAEGITPWDRGRHVFVAHRGRVARFRTRTRDFSDVEIEATKLALGQVYVDRSDKPAPDDFAADLRQLRRAALCAPCPERERCTGMWEVVPEDVFTRDDRRVRELVASLDGDVLDVGCGHGPYADVLAPRAEAGTIRYVGIDPDAARIEQLRARWPWAELRVAEAESIDGAGVRQFDHVLILRSWNHLRDPAHALAELVDALRPGGTMTIVDNVAFGLVRTREQADRGERSDAGFEHYRNDAAADAHRVAAGFELELIERRDVAPGTSNQWFLHYRAR